ncbi:MAG: hypothetical protein ACRD2W_04975 [Acidimicrobiales bacterium]
MSITDVLRSDTREEPRRTRRPDVVSFGLLGAAVALWLASLSQVNLDDLSDIGLISALPPAFFLSVALLTVGFFREIGRRDPRPAFLWAHTVLVVVFLQGIAAAVEGAPRFPTSWIHAGFTDQIADHHSTLPMLDARFSWPGFFSVAALVETVAGLESALWFVRWSPVVFGLVALAPAAVILRVAEVEDRARWTALWLFCVANWVGQDYFAPQALNAFLYLVVVAVLLKWFRPYALRPVPLLGSRVGTLEAPVAASTPRARVALVLVVTGLFAASVLSHQLTPFALAAAAAALVVGRRSVLAWLPVLFVVGALAWLSWGAEVYWIGHLSNVTGGIGRLTGSLQSGVAERLQGNTGHLFVIRLRMIATGLLWVVAAAGALRSYRRTGAVPWPHVLLMAAPFSLVALQSYGGEILLRVYLFALPFVALLVALAFFPTPLWRDQRPSRSTIFGAAALSVVVTLAFLVIRYGNERFESFTADEVAAVEWVYDNAPAGSRLVAVNPSLPWKHRDLEKYSYLSLIEKPHLDEGGEILSYLIPKKGRADGYLIITRSQIAHGELVQGFKPGWDERVAELLLSTGQARVVFQNDDAIVIHHPGTAT